MKKCFFLAVLASVVILVPVWNVAFARNEPAFYPGGHGQLPMASGPGLVDAMRKIATAGNDDDLKAALAVVRKMVDGGDAEAAFRLGRYYHLETAHPDYTMALELYQKHHGLSEVDRHASELGDREATWGIAKMYTGSPPMFWESTSREIARIRVPSLFFSHR